jgi:hypothetical protein
MPFKLDHYCEEVLHLSKASLAMTTLRHEEYAFSLIDVNNLDADANIVHSRLSITSPSKGF